MLSSQSRAIMVVLGLVAAFVLATIYVPADIASLLALSLAAGGFTVAAALWAPDAWAAFRRGVDGRPDQLLVVIFALCASIATLLLGAAAYNLMGRPEWWPESAVRNATYGVAVLAVMLAILVATQARSWHRRLSFAAVITIAAAIVAAVQMLIA